MLLTDRRDATHLLRRQTLRGLHVLWLEHLKIPLNLRQKGPLVASSFLFSNADRVSSTTWPPLLLRIYACLGWCRKQFYKLICSTWVPVQSLLLTHPFAQGGTCPFFLLWITSGERSEQTAAEGSSALSQARQVTSASQLGPYSAEAVLLLPAGWEK